MKDVSPLSGSRQVRDPSAAPGTATVAYGEEVGIKGDIVIAGLAHQDPKGCWGKTRAGGKCRAHPIGDSHMCAGHTKQSKARSA